MPNEKDAAVQSVARSMEILELLCAQPAGLAIRELTKETKLSKSTVHRLLQSLIALGYVKKSDADIRYRATLKLFEISSNLVGRTDMLSLVQPYLQTLAQQVNETVHFVVQDGCDVVYVFKAEAGDMRLSSRLGHRVPLYCSGTGKAILAMKEAPEVAQIWQQSVIRANTKNTVQTLSALQAQLHAVRRKGWALDDAENEPGICCVAVALPQVAGMSPAAFSISGMKAVMDEERIANLAQECLRVKQEIVQALGLA